MDLKDFLSFRRMITPLIIQVLFWIGVVISVLYGLGVLLFSVISGIIDGEIVLILGGVCVGPIIIVLGVVSTRIYSELLILFFRINDTLTDIKNAVEQKK